MYFLYRKLGRCNIEVTYFWTNFSSSYIQFDSFHFNRCLFVFSFCLYNNLHTVWCLQHEGKVGTVRESKLPSKHFFMLVITAQSLCVGAAKHYERKHITIFKNHYLLKSKITRILNDLFDFTAFT